VIAKCSEGHEFEILNWGALPKRCPHVVHSKGCVGIPAAKFPKKESK